MLSARTMRFIVLTTVLVSGSLDAQTSRTALELDSVPVSIVDAEEQGRRFTPLIARAVLPPQFSDSSVAGSAQRRCVQVHEEPMVRAGDFLIGPFNDQASHWPSKKLWWVPASHAGEMRVTATHLDRAAPTRIFHQKGVAHPTGGDTTDTFHPSMIRIYGRGPWMLVATSGSSWGCILVEVP